MLVTFVMLPAAPASVAFVVFGGGARGGMNGGGTLGGVSGGNNALPLAPVCMGDSLVALWTLSSRSPRVVPGVPAFVVRLASAPLDGLGIATFLRPLGFGDCWPDRKNPLALDDSPMGARVLMLLLPFKFRGEGLFLPIDNLFRDMLVFAAERTIGVLRRTARVKALAKTVLIVVLAGP